MLNQLKKKRVQFELNQGLLLSTFIIVMMLFLYACEKEKTEPALPTLSIEKLREVMVPINLQADTDFHVETKSFRETVESGAFELPPNMIFTPNSCSSYLEDVVGTPEGWVQYGSRTTHTHNNFFLQLAVIIPGGVDMEKIRESALTCDVGTITLEDRIIADVTSKEISTPDFKGATTFAMKQVDRFSNYTDPADIAIIESFGFESGVDCIQYSMLIAQGEVLMLIMDFDQIYGTGVATRMYDNLQGLL